MQQERLGALGGAGRFMNMFSAMKIAGLSDPEILYRAMEAGEFEYNHKILIDGDPRHERSGIQIDWGTFLQWIDRRNQLPIVQTKENIRELLIKVSLIQAEAYENSKVLRELVRVFEKQNNRPMGLRRARRKKIT